MIVKKPKLLIVNPHPDDGEAFCANICAQAVRFGWEIHQVLATCDEYGTPIVEFKGKRIQQIRKHEMMKAAKAYGIDSYGNSIVKLHWMNYIDGYVPHNRTAVIRLQNFILKLDPDVVIGPDPFIYMDGHVDHIAVGKNYYFALKWMNSKQRPRKMFFFQSLMPDFFLPVLPEDKNTVIKARLAHKSQWSSNEAKLLEFFPLFLQLHLKFKKGFLKNMEGYRYVKFQSKDHVPKGLARLIFVIFRDRPIGCEEDRLLPGPEHFGLITEPEDEIFNKIGKSTINSF